MYHNLSILASRSSSVDLEKSIAGRRRDGREPGRLASSTASLASVSAREEGSLEEGVVVEDTRAVGAEGCEMLF